MDDGTGEGVEEVAGRAGGQGCERGFGFVYESLGGAAGVVDRAGIQQESAEGFGVHGIDMSQGFPAILLGGG